MKYRKKPVEVEAFLFDGKNAVEVYRFMGIVHEVDYNVKAEAECYDYFIREKNKCGILINTLEGEMLATPGDYIIKGVKGEFYPCKPDVFEMTYEIS